MKTIDTFSANSLKILDKSLFEFKNKYLYNLFWLKKDDRALLGQKFHSLICYYLKGFDTKKLTYDLSDEEKNYWEKLKIFLKDKKKDFIKTEYSFLIKEKLENQYYYLSGRFDAIYKKDDEYTIYDWKTLNIPHNADNDLQSIVYLYSLFKIIKSKKIKLRYLSIEKLDFIDIEFKDSFQYKKRIDDIVFKYYNDL